MRCPVPYALLALFGWGLLDVVAERFRVVAERVRGWIRRPPRRAPLAETSAGERASEPG